MFGKKQAAALVAEFVGTGVLTLIVLSVQRSTIGVPFFVAAAAGLTVALMSFAVAAVSGGYFNPALTVGSWSARRLQTTTAILYIAVQFAGAWAAYWLYTYFVNNSLQPIGGKYTGRILTAEIVGTAIFAYAWASAMYQKFTVGLGGAVAGIALMIGIIAASSASLGLLNPAVALGVRAFTPAYVAGPIIGAVVGFNLYALLMAGSETKVAAKTAAAPAAAKKAPAKRKSSKAKAKK